MAGKVVVSTLNNDTGVLATQNGMTGIAKAWVTFDGTGTPAITGSFNVSSITDNGTGDYTVNFTTAMPNTNYAGQVGIGTLGASDGVGGGYSGATRTTSSFRIATLNASQSTLKDFATIYVAIFSS
jgi:hypothetical protein